MIIQEAPNYSIKGGEVYNNITGKKLKPVISGSGYPVVRMRNNGKYVNMSMHVLVAKYELGVVAEVIEHKDDNKLNYSPDNLFGSTQSANISKALGVPVVGTHIESGEKVYFDTVAAAGRFVGCEPSRISAICRNKIGYKTAGGYTWSYRKKEVCNDAH